MAFYNKIWAKIWNTSVYVSKDDSFICKLKITSINVFKIFYNSVIKFLNDDGVNKAGALAFTTVISFIPLLMVAFSLMSSFSSFDELKTEFRDYLFTEFIPGVGEQVRNAVISLMEQSEKLKVSAVIFLFVTATSMFRTLEGCMENIWMIRQNRSPLEKFRNFYLVVTLGPLFLAVSFYILQTQLAIGLKFLFPTMITVGVFFLIYQLLPNTNVSIRASIIGALVAGIFFEAAKWGFGQYSKILGSTASENLYGTLWFLPIFFLWIYFSFVIVIFGSVLSFVIQHYKRMGKLSLGYDTKVDQKFQDMKLYLTLSSLKLIYMNFYKRNKDSNEFLTKRADIVSFTKAEENGQLNLLFTSIDLLEEKKIIYCIKEDDFYHYIPSVAPDELKFIDFLKMINIQPKVPAKQNIEDIKNIIIDFDDSIFTMLNDKYKNLTLKELLID